MFTPRNMNTEHCTNKEIQVMLESEDKCTERHTKYLKHQKPELFYTEYNVIKTQQQESKRPAKRFCIEVSVTDF